MNTLLSCSLCSPRNADWGACGCRIGALPWICWIWAPTPSVTLTANQLTSQSDESMSEKWGWCDPWWCLKCTHLLCTEQLMSVTIKVSSFTAGQLEKVLTDTFVWGWQVGARQNILNVSWKSTWFLPLFIPTALQVCWMMLLQFSQRCFSLCGVVVVITMKTHTSVSFSRQTPLELTNAANWHVTKHDVVAVLVRVQARMQQAWLLLSLRTVSYIISSDSLLFR